MTKNLINHSLDRKRGIKNTPNSLNYVPALVAAHTIAIPPNTMAK